MIFLLSVCLFLLLSVKAGRNSACMNSSRLNRGRRMPEGIGRDIQDRDLFLPLD